MNDSSYKKPVRLSFPSSESARSWLGILLDAYHIADRGVAEAIAKAEQRGKKLACAKGCSSCCATHISIPVYPIELVGISWYATEKTEGPVREKLRMQLDPGDENSACPFLVNGACAIHPLRPMACRHFNVFGKPCAEGEDAYYTRRKDVLKPIVKYKNEALKTTLPFYKVSDPATVKQMIKGGVIHRLAKDLRAIDWQSLIEKMAEFDRTGAT